MAFLKTKPLLRYRPLSFKDLTLLHTWYQQAHVKQWYSRQSFDLDQLEKKYKPYILGKNKIQGFICYSHDQPFGYIQYYPVKHYPWDQHDLKNKLSLSAGLDAFIGERSFLGKGFGQTMIQRFVRRHIWKEYAYCVVDPHVDNKKAIGCYNACGFTLHKTILSEENEPHYLMVKKASSA